MEQDLIAVDNIQIIFDKKIYIIEVLDIQYEGTVCKECAFCKLCTHSQIRQITAICDCIATNKFLLFDFYWKEYIS